MKNIFIYLLGIGILLVSCEKDIEVVKSSLTVSNEEVTPSYNSAEIAVDFAPVQITDHINSGTHFDKVLVQYATSKDFAEYQEEEMQDLGTWRASLTNLQPNTTYYVRYFVKNKYSSAISNEVSEFKTLALSLPSITTSAVTQIRDTSAIAGGNVTSDGGMSVTERGVVYSTSSNPTTANSKVTSGSGTGSFTCSLTNLQESTTYYVRAYAINEKGTAYGEQKSFTTKVYTLPTVTTSSATNISTTSVTVGGNVTADGGMSVTERGVVYSTVSNPVINNIYHTTKVVGSGTGSFSVNLTNLVKGTTYYVRAYATNEKGTAYGNQVIFTTLEALIENGHEYVDLGLSVKWATCNVGASSPEDYGDYFAWGETEPKSTYDRSTYKYYNGSSSGYTKYCTNSSYGIVDNKTTLDLSDDAARANWGGSWRMPTQAEQDELRNNCTWTWTTQNGVKGYKVTSKSNGNSIFLPAAGYRDVSSLNYAGSDGSYWSSSLNTDYPSDAYDLLFDSSGVVWSYGSRCCGQSVRPVYGEYIPASTLPTVTTSSATNISKTSATVGGNVTSDGGASVTERGVVYSTSSNPTTSNNKVMSGSGTGSFTCNITNLQEGTTYYVRAYATNEKGTAYGAEKSFTTSSVALPTVTTSSATNIAYTTATVGGNVTSDGGAIVTERGVVYSTSQNPTTSNSKVTNGSGTGSFSVNLTNLVKGTTYYVRAYATNEKGTAYGNQVVFTTLELVYEYVDLGLSVKWATCNVGASSPEEYGDYFAWGETEPKSTYNWSTYKYCNGSLSSLTKYCTSSSDGTVDNKTQLELSDDAARANWGGSWRMPTQAEQDELRNNCTWTWTTQNGVKGYKVTSKSNGNSIFLPAAGRRSDSWLSHAGSYGYYWSSSLRTSTPSGAYYLFFSLSNVDWFHCDRYIGYSVRPVCP